MCLTDPRQERLGRPPKAPKPLGRVWIYLEKRRHAIEALGKLVVPVLVAIVSGLVFLKIGAWEAARAEQTLRWETTRVAIDLLHENQPDAPFTTWAQEQVEAAGIELNPEIRDRLRQGLPFGPLADLGEIALHFTGAGITTPSGDLRLSFAAVEAQGDTLALQDVRLVIDGERTFSWPRLEVDKALRAVIGGVEYFFLLKQVDEGVATFQMHSRQLDL